MIDGLLAQAGEFIKFTFVPSLVLALVVPIAAAWMLGKGGSRSLDDTGAAGKFWGAAAVAALFVALFLWHVAFVVFGLLDSVSAGLFFGVIGGLALLAFGLSWLLLRDGGWLREQIDAIRDPMRVRGEQGSAHFCTPREFRRFLVRDEAGLPFLGAFWGARQDPATGRRRYMRLDRGKGYMYLSGEDIARGILTIGGPGSGKSQSIILPSIADHMLAAHSVILVDPQGELTRNVMKFAAATGHQVIVHDPTSQTYPRYNLADGVSSISDARSIADVLVPSAGGENKFWSDSAAALLSACLIRFDNLGDIYTAMSDMEGVGKRLREHEDDAFRLANSFLASLDTDGRLATNVVATLATSLTGWADNTAREATSASDFTAQMIVEQPTVAVLACPGRQRAIYAPYLGGVLRKLMLDLDTIGEKNRGPLPIPVGIILDEFPTLGKLDSLVADVNLVRKRRISILIAAQTKGQFHMIYGPDATNALLAGMATQIIFGGGDQETSDFYSRASGTATEYSAEGAGMPNPFSADPQQRQKPQKHQRQLLTPDEIQTPARGNATIFTRYVTESYATQLVMWAKPTRMYERADWKSKLDSVSEDDAFVLQRPLTFGAPAPGKSAEAVPGR